MKTSAPKRRRALIVAHVFLALTTACSVSTPRDGMSQQAAAQGNAAQGGEAAQLGGDGGTAVAGNGGVSGLGVASGGSPATRGAGTSDAQGSAGSGGANTQGPSAARGTAPDSTGAAKPSGPVPGVTAKELRFSIIASFSGIYGQILDDAINDGVGTWVDDINAHGGIYGRKLVMVKVDNRGTVEGGIAACKTIQSNNSYFAYSAFGENGANFSSTDCLDRAGIPTFSYLLESYNKRWQNVYSVNETTESGRPLASFIKNVLKKGSGKIGVIIERDPQFAATAGAFREGMGKEGLKIVHTEETATNQGSFISELTRMRDAGVDVLVMLVGGAPGIGIPRDARSLNYQPTFTGSLWLHDEFSAAGAGFQKGISGLRTYASKTSPAYPKFVALAQKYGRGQAPTALHMSYYGQGLLMQKAIEGAGPSPTRQNFGPAIERIVNYNNEIISASFGPGNRRAAAPQYPITCCGSDNTWTGIGPPKEIF